MEQKRYSFDDFVKIIEQLRGEDGCPWDRVQTHESLKPCMIEEAAEAVAAVRDYTRTGDDTNLREELGDVLLQVVMHSTIASEEGRFSIDEVIQTVSEKMIRRHPHVFGNTEADTPKQVLENWEEIKKQEKGGSKNTGPADIPVELPALMRAQKALKRLNKVDGSFDSLTDSAALIQEALDSLPEPQQEESAAAPLAALLLHAVNLTRLYGLDAEQVLADETAELLRQCEKNVE